jgi:chemotaxis protein CheY-P-specific phosphatase CheC
MQDQPLKSALSEVLRQVLEQTAFVFVDSETTLENIDATSLELIRISVSFSGAREGSVSLILPLELCREFSNNMLGQPPSDSDSRESQIDAAKEVANIMTGQLLTEIYGKQEIFSQSAPEVSELPLDQFYKVLEENEYNCSSVDDYPVIVMMSEARREHEHQGLSR